MFSCCRCCGRCCGSRCGRCLVVVGVLVGVLNFKTILNEMPNGNSYRVTGNGRLVKKAEGENVERRGWHNNNRRPPPNEAMQHSPERHDSTASTS